MNEILPLDLALGLVSALACVALILMFLLYLSMRRDVRRLSGLRERDPLHAQIDFETSERILDRAELELEQLYTERGEPVPGTAEFAAVAGTTEVHPGTDTHPVTGEPLTGDHPALDQLTMERSALIPHPRWRRFVATVTKPRWLAVIAIAALLIGVGAIYGVSTLLEQGSDEPAAPASAIDPGSVAVIVLNGTSDAGLGGQTSQYVDAAGFTDVEVGVIDGKFSVSEVQYAAGQREAASEVAHELGIEQISEYAPEVEREAGDAEIAVIVGEDREL